MNIIIGETDAEVVAPVLWPTDEKNQLIGKDLDAGKDWRQKDKEDGRRWDDYIASLMQYEF